MTASFWDNFSFSRQVHTITQHSRLFKAEHQGRTGFHFRVILGPWLTPRCALCSLAPPPCECSQLLVHSAFCLPPYVCFSCCQYRSAIPHSFCRLRRRHVHCDVANWGLIEILGWVLLSWNGSLRGCLPAWMIVRKMNLQIRPLDDKLLSLLV